MNRMLIIACLVLLFVSSASFAQRGPSGISSPADRSEPSEPEQTGGGIETGGGAGQSVGGGSGNFAVESRPSLQRPPDFIGGSTQRPPGGLGQSLPGLTPLPDDSSLSRTAEWRVCNDSSEPEIFVAISHHDGRSWQKRGWFAIPRGLCVPVVSAIRSGAAYYYAYAASGQTWEGETPFCVNPGRAFALDDNRCPAGHGVVGFNRVDLRRAPEATSIH